MKNKKVAIVLMNLGGPSDLRGVREFLFNLFYDDAIIRLPNPFRWIIAKLISSKRDKYAQEIYRKIGGKSPILEETKKQAKALEETLDNSKVFISMRYSSPRSFEIVKDIKKYAPEKIILLPLYPQFSTTTTASSIKDMMGELRKEKLDDITTSICCYADDIEFIEAHVQNIKSTLKNLKSQNFRMLFSAHGLPEKVIKSGDPYQYQIEVTVQKVVDSLKIKNLDYRITYQSKVGPMKWLMPDTEEEIKEACREGKALVIVPIAFVSEHSETLVELDIEYMQIAKDKKIEYLRVPTLSSSDKFISALRDMVKKFINDKNLLASSSKMCRICPNGFTGCFCK
jgi:ferrochelatase